MRLTGEQYQQFTLALVDAYPLQRLREMLRFRLDKNLDAIALGDDLTAVVFRLIGASQAEGWTDRLLLAARESNPGNAGLLAVAQQFGLAPATPPRDALEKIIKQANGFLDVAAWRGRLGEIEARVCRIEIPGRAGTTYGTGFLLGPDVVMTNHHVVRPLLDEQDTTPESAVLRFDYKRLADGTTLNPGTKYRLAPDGHEAWLIDASPPSQVDVQPDPKSGQPLPTELDYAVLRTAGRPGVDQVGGGADPGAPPRGWIELPEAPLEPEPGSVLFIVQHPRGAPLKLAIDTVTARNSNGTRLRYATNTEGGSSGSPCFDVNWNLVALHHSGDPSFVPAYNEGIPFAAILELLRERGFQTKLGTSY